MQREEVMKKETAAQMQRELEVVESEIRKMEYHLVGLDSAKWKKEYFRRTEESEGSIEKLLIKSGQMKLRTKIKRMRDVDLPRYAKPGI